MPLVSNFCLGELKDLPVGMQQVGHEDGTEARLRLLNGADFWQGLEEEGKAEQATSEISAF